MYTTVDEDFAIKPMNFALNCLSISQSHVLIGSSLKLAEASLDHRYVRDEGCFARFCFVFVVSGRCTPLYPLVRLLSRSRIRLLITACYAPIQPYRVELSTRPEDSMKPSS